MIGSVGAVVARGAVVAQAEACVADKSHCAVRYSRSQRFADAIGGAVVVIPVSVIERARIASPCRSDKIVRVRAVVEKFCIGNVTGVELHYVIHVFAFSDLQEK